MSVKEFLKPLFSYQKYWMSHKILKKASTPYIWLCDDEGKADPQRRIHKIGMPRIDYQWLIKEYPNVSPIKIIQSLDLLESKSHIQKLQKDNLLLYGVFATKEGVQAYHDGYYIKKIYLFWFGVIGTPATIIGIITLIRSIL